jgi:hypothetical protein
MTTIRLRPEELELLGTMIAKRDSAHLSGHTNEPFQLVTLNGGSSILVFPGQTGRQEVPTMTIDRLMNLQAFQPFSRNKNVMTFDLADDIRDKLERLKDDAGQPSLLAQERHARSRAEGRQSELETALQRGERQRLAQRQAFAARVGHRVKWFAVGGLVVVYVAATVVTAILTEPLAVFAVALGLLLVSSILDWVFHLDAYQVVRWLEAKAAARAERWAEQFDSEES